MGGTFNSGGSHVKDPNRLNISQLDWEEKQINSPPHIGCFYANVIKSSLLSINQITKKWGHFWFSQVRMSQRQLCRRTGGLVWAQVHEPDNLVGELTSFKAYGIQQSPRLTSHNLRCGGIPGCLGFNFPRQHRNCSLDSRNAWPRSLSSSLVLPKGDAKLFGLTQ